MNFFVALALALAAAVTATPVPDAAILAPRQLCGVSCGCLDTAGKPSTSQTSACCVPSGGELLAWANGNVRRDSILVAGLPVISPHSTDPLMLLAGFLLIKLVSSAFLPKPVSAIFRPAAAAKESMSAVLALASEHFTLMQEMASVRCGLASAEGGEGAM